MSLSWFSSPGNVAAHDDRHGPQPTMPTEDSDLTNRQRASWPQPPLKYLKPALPRPQD